MRKSELPPPRLESPKKSALSQLTRPPRLYQGQKGHGGYRSRGSSDHTGGHDPARGPSAAARQTRGLSAVARQARGPRIYPNFHKNFRKYGSVGYPF